MNWNIINTKLMLHYTATRITSSSARHNIALSKKEKSSPRFNGPCHTILYFISFCWTGLYQAHIVLCHCPKYWQTIGKCRQNLRIFWTCDTLLVWKMSCSYMTYIRILHNVSLSTYRSLQRSTESLSHCLLIIFCSTPGQIQPEYPTWIWQIADGI